MFESNVKIASHLRILAELFKAGGKSYWAYNAWYNAAITIESYDDEILSDFDFWSIKGVGDSIGAEIVEYFTHGNITPLFCKWAGNIPEGKVTRLQALEFSNDVIEDFENFGIECELLGSIRREKPFVSDIDIMVKNTEFHKVYELINKINMRIVSGGSRKIRCEFMGMGIDIRITESEAEVPFHRLMMTGSASLNVRMRKTAKEMGYTLNEYGMFNIITGNRVEGLDSEAAIFKVLGMDFIKPTKR